MSGKRNIHLLLILLVTLAAFAVRVHALDYQSMWSDEGLSLYRASQPLQASLSNVIIVDGIETKDTNPAFYFLLLHGWRSLTGESVFALRFLGAAIATLSVPLIYGLATAVFQHNVGLATAVFMAISPLHVWQSQILRNYGLLITLNLLSVYALTRFLLAPHARRRWTWLGLWAAAGFLSVVTHYFGFFVVAFGGLILAVFLARQWLLAASASRKPPSRWFWIIVLLLLLLLVPLVVTAYGRFQIGRQVDFYFTPPQDFFIHALNVFSAGDIPGIVHPLWRVLPAGLLALLGLFWAWRISRAGFAFIFGYLLVPLSLLILLSAITPLYNGTRHLLIALPPFLIFCGAGVAGGWAVLPPAQQGLRRAFRLLRWAGPVLGLLTLLIQVNRLAAQFSDPDYVRDDIRGVAEYLNRYATAEDVIILHDTLIGFTFDYYYEGNAPWLAVPRFGQADEAAVTAVFAEAGAVPGRIWFVSYPTPRTGFPREYLIHWADENWTHLTTKPFPSFWLNTELRAYLANPGVTGIDKAAETATAIYPNLQLHGLRHTPTIQAGQPWWLTLYWSKLSDQNAAYSLSLRLVDEEGLLWQQADIPLWNDFAALPPDAPLYRTDHELIFNTGLPPGEYTLTLRLLDESKQPIPTTDGQIDLPLTQVTAISSYDPGQLPSLTHQTVQLGPITLLGYQLPDSSARPGHLIPLTLYWQAAAHPRVDYQLRAELLNEQGAVIAETTAPLTRAAYPTTLWQPGEILQGMANLTVPATAVPGPHTIRLSLIRPDGRAEGRPVTLDTTATVENWPLLIQLPPIAEEIGAVFGQPPQLRLVGLDLPERSSRPGQPLPLTLTWQTIQPPDTNYNVFVHLVNADDEIVAQRDGMPAQGFRPTAGWRSGEVIIDEHTLDLPPDLPPGVYRLLTGLYVPETFERPLTTLDGAEVPDGRIPLGDITIEAAE